MGPFGQGLERLAKTRWRCVFCDTDQLNTLACASLTLECQSVADFQVVDVSGHDTG